MTYLLVDGENLDATLGGSVLGRKPGPGDRPRWERAVEFVGRTWDAPVSTLFFIHAAGGHIPGPFVQALQSRDIRPVLLSGPPGMKVVDVAILRTLAAIAERPGDVVLASHDGDFVDGLRPLLADGRRVGLLALREYVSGAYAPLEADGLRVFDLEDDAGCFTYVLPRVRVIPIEEFDPAAYL